MPTALELRRRAVADAFREARRPSRDDVVDERLRDVEHQLAEVQLRVADVVDRLDGLDGLDAQPLAADRYVGDDEAVGETVPLPPLITAGGMSATASRALFGV